MLGDAEAVVDRPVAPRREQPRRATDLVTADMADATTVGFDLTQMLEAPVGRADAFGVGKVENPSPK